MSQLALALEADWAFPRLLCCCPAKCASSSFQKSSWKGERREGSRRARQSAAGFAWTEIPESPEHRNLSYLGSIVELRDRFQSHSKNNSSKKKEMRGKTEPSHQRHWNMPSCCLYLLVLIAHVSAPVKTSCLVLVAVLCVRSRLKRSEAICQCGFSSYCEPSH